MKGRAGPLKKRVDVKLRDGCKDWKLAAGGQLERSGLAVWWCWPKAFLLSVNEWISEPSTQWGLTVDDALPLFFSSCKYALWFHHTGVYTAAKLKSCFCISDLMAYSLAPKRHVANMRILVLGCFFFYTFFSLALLSIGFKKYITINYWYLQMTRMLSCSWVGDVRLRLSDCNHCSICGNLSELYWLILTDRFIDPIQKRRAKRSWSKPCFPDRSTAFQTKASQACMF